MEFTKLEIMLLDYIKTSKYVSHYSIESLKSEMSYVASRNIKDYEDSKKYNKLASKYEAKLDVIKNSLILSEYHLNLFDDDIEYE